MSECLNVILAIMMLFGGHSSKSLRLPSNCCQNKSKIDLARP